MQGTRALPTPRFTGESNPLRHSAPSFLPPRLALGIIGAWETLLGLAVLFRWRPRLAGWLQIGTLLGMNAAGARSMLRETLAFKSDLHFDGETVEFEDASPLCPAVWIGKKIG